MESGTLMIFIVSWLMLQKILEVQQIQSCYVWLLPIMLLVLIAIVHISVLEKMMLMTIIFM